MDNVLTGTVGEGEGRDVEANGVQGGGVDVKCFILLKLVMAMLK